MLLLQTDSNLRQASLFCTPTLNLFQTFSVIELQCVCVCVFVGRRGQGREKGGPEWVQGFRGKNGKEHRTSRRDKLAFSMEVATGEKEDILFFLYSSELTS